MPVMISDSLAAQLRIELGVPTIPPPNAIPTPAAAGSDLWPQIVTLADGTHVKAKAPFNPAWQTSMMGRILGGEGHYVFDPSNGDQFTPPMPLRTPAGFPLVYAAAPNADGTLSAVGTPTVLYADQVFNSDAEVLEYIRRTAPNDVEAARQWAETFARMGR